MEGKKKEKDRKNENGKPPHRSYVYVYETIHTETKLIIETNHSWQANCLSPNMMRRGTSCRMVRLTDTVGRIESVSVVAEERVGRINSSSLVITGSHDFFQAINSH